MGIGMQEMLIILLVVLVLFGAKKLPEIGGGLGRAIRNFKRASSEPDEIDISPRTETKAQENPTESTASSAQADATDTTTKTRA